MKLAVLVFGYAVTPKGQQYKEQEKRVKRGVSVFIKENADFLILSGGFGNLFNRTKKSLAWHMAKQAIYLGIPKKKIVLENKSKDTLENILFSKRVVDKLKCKKGICVSSKYHLPRIKKICEVVFGLAYNLKYIGVPFQPSKFFTPQKEKEYLEENLIQLDKFGYLGKVVK